MNRNYFSLGTNCTIGYNLKHFKMMKSSGLVDSFISPYSGLLWLFENKFNLVTDSFDYYLDKVSIANTDTIIHRPSGLIMHHAFSRRDDGRIIENWKSEVNNVSNKYKFLGDRMRNSIFLSENPIFFITHDILSDEDKDRILSPYQANISKSDDVIFRIIKQARISFERNLKFVCVDIRENTKKSIINLDGTKIEELHYYGEWHDDNPSHFGGCKRGWRELFDRVNNSII